MHIRVKENIKHIDPVQQATENIMRRSIKEHSHRMVLTDDPFIDMSGIWKDGHYEQVFKKGEQNANVI